MTRFFEVHAVDPGPVNSAWAHIESPSSGVYKLVDFGFMDSKVLRDQLVTLAGNTYPRSKILAIEDIVFYQMTAGAAVFETCVWIGRFMEAWGDDSTIARIPRPDCAQRLVGQRSAKDSQMVAATYARFGAKSLTEAKGTKKFPGPLYGVTEHVWSAIAVGLTYIEKAREG